MNPMMKCGHSANAIDGDGNQCCVICVGDPKSKQIDEEYNPGERTARCTYYGKTYTPAGHRYGCECGKCRKQTDGKCHCEEPSNTDLAFFHAHPNKEFDEFYCGCMSWE